MAKQDNDRQLKTLRTECEQLRAEDARLREELSKLGVAASMPPVPDMAATERRLQSPCYGNVFGGSEDRPSPVAFPLKATALWNTRFRPSAVELYDSPETSKPTADFKLGVRTLQAAR